MIHRSEKFDRYIGRKVRVDLRDGTILRGVLSYCDKPEGTELSGVSEKKDPFKPGWYYAGDKPFRKTNVKKMFPIL